MRLFYKVVLQAVFLFGSEALAVTPHIGRKLGGFHHRVALQLMSKKPHIQTDSIWEYPLPGGGDEGRGIGGGGGVHHVTEEHGGPIHLSAADPRPKHGYGVD